MSTNVSALSVRKRSGPRNSKPSVRICVREQRDSMTMSSPEVCWPIPMRAIGAQNLLTMPGGVSSAGYLHKKGGSQFSLMKWPLRYVIVHKGCVYYFKSSTSPSPQGAFSLSGYNRVMRAAEETTSSNVFPFKIIHFSKRHRTWIFSAASEDERRKWMRHLRREIDYYNDHKDTALPCDSDSDADSFYGSIERPMDIKHLDSNTEDDYMEEDEEEDEEDYLKPDTDCSSPSTSDDAHHPSRPGHPPSYPPPPVPEAFRRDSSPVFLKGPPPPVPSHHRSPTLHIPKKSLPPFPPPPIPKDANKGPPPPIHFSPHLHKIPSLEPPPPPPPNPKRTPLSRGPPTTEPDGTKKEHRLTSHPYPATLPICEQIESRMVLNRPTHPPLIFGANSLGHKPNNHRLSQIAGSCVRPGTSESFCQPPLSDPPLLSAQLKTGLNKPVPPKPPPPEAKFPVPSTRSKSHGSSIQSSPEGQSFRSSGDEAPSESRRRRSPDLGRRGAEDCSEDEDYINMLLPDSVFIDTNETSFVEKLFRERRVPPEDGLYSIRNSGTKTSRVLVVWDSSINKARNYRLFEDGDHIYLDSEVTFPSLSALIEHYHSQPLPHHGSLCLLTPFSYTM
ncbi:SH3 domain-binding protein 2 isoform X2 [Cynoglossus semilaevis]|uniref:SH3 domain-binding protein 2 isoform X2 n=1 Tax=Cynoglossus semilaevis TaxID=244447 RepID=UPI0007DCA99A|nr:SH3 domain-binding protein 2 isoform X2 [Cynoglossus semilaevis]